MEKTYKPISCDYYDILLDFATKKQEVSIVLTSEEGNDPMEFSDIIIDVFTKKGEEFMNLKSGNTYRLDRIISVNGIELNGFCAI